MRLPDPIANTTTEAYLAYKAGVLAVDDLQPKLYEPYIHLDAWLAYWTGLVATYPVDKNNDPEMLTDEEAYIAYLSGVTNTYPEEFRDPADVRVAAYLRYLISARWGRPEYPVNNEELYLSMLKTKYIPSGDPSSDIVIDGTTKAPFVDVKLYGDTFQQTYSGKNLWNAVIEVSGWNASGGSFANTARARSRTKVAVQPNTEYTLSMVPRDAGKTINMTVQGWAADNTFVIQITGPDWASVPVTFTTPANCTQITISGRYSDNTSFGTLYSETDVFQNIQLETGSQATSYEPYVGGIPAPNPDYPQQIQTVTGEQTVEIVGKNKIKSSTTGSIDWRGTAVTYSGDQIIISKSSNGGITASAHTGTIYTPLNANQAYTFSMSYKSGTINLDYTDYWRFYLYAVSADGSISTTNRWTIALPRTTTPSAKVTFTPSEDFIGYRLGCYIPGPSPTTTGDVVFNVQLELGSTATSFAPYSKQTLPLALGSIELCKLGTYQDYIYKSGDDWKVHKAVKKSVFDQNSGWTKNQYGTNAYGIKTEDVFTAVAEIGVISPQFIAKSYNGRTDAVDNIIFADSNDGMSTTSRGISIRNTAWSDLSSFITWVTSNPVTAYYVLATPTDTTITDSTLIAQLDSLVNGGAEDGTTYIKVSATDPNLPGLLYVEAPKYE